MNSVESNMPYALYCKSCERMDEVGDESVHLVVTSPPYWNAIDYDQHVTDESAWYRTRRGGPYGEYLDFMKACFTEVYRKQVPGGFCAVIIGTVLQNGRQYSVPQNLTNLMEEIGFIFHEDIIWHKVTGGVKRAGVTIQKPFPGYYCPNIMTESILMFRKPGPKIYESRSLEEKEISRYEIDGIFTREIANNVWHIAPVPPNYLPHPCPFLEEIPYRLVSLYSYTGDLVLDPFMGIGTTAKVALALSRRFVGYEIHAKYIEVTKERLAEPLHLRDQLIARFEKMPLQDQRYLHNQILHEDNPKNDPQLTIPGFEVHEQRATYRAPSDRSMDRIDYSLLKKQAKWLHKPRRKMVISPDIDGVLSAMLCQHVLGWELVGFYDASTLWTLEKYKDIENSDVIFIDHDINRRTVPSVGHHMLQWGADTQMPEHIGPEAQSANPNLIRGFTFNKHFSRKYPFGTFHFLVACYSAWGNLKNFQPSRDFVPVMLYIDSSLSNAFNFQENALDWLDWLGWSDDDASPIYPMCRLISKASPRRLLEWGSKLEKEVVALGFTKGSQCKVRNPLDPEEWARFSKLSAWLEDLTGWSFKAPDFPSCQVSTRSVERKSCKPTKTNFVAVIEKQPFSFALISRADEGLNYGFLHDIT